MCLYEYSERLAEDLWQAVVYDSAYLVEGLLEQGADPNHPLYWSESLTGWQPKSPLHTACENCNLKIVKLLHNAGADINNKGDR